MDTYADSTGSTAPGPAFASGSIQVGREMEVPRLLDRLEEALRFAVDRAELVAVRVQPVLRPEDDSPMLGEPVPPVLTAVGQRLDQLCDMAQSLGRRLDALAGRVEV